MRTTRTQRMAARIASAALVCGLAWTAVAAAADVPESEPNGTTATATALNPGTNCFATGTGAINPDADEDFWSVPQVAGERAWAAVDTGGAANENSESDDSTLELFGADGTTLLEHDDDDGTGNGGDATIESSRSSLIAGKTLPATGTGYLRVTEYETDFSGAQTINLYRILYATTSNAPVPESASNDTLATAMAAPGCKTPVGASIGTEGDVDYYAVTLAAGQRLFYAADGDPERDGEAIDIVVEVRDAADTVLLTSDEAGTGDEDDPGAEGTDFVAPSAGTYYLAVREEDGLDTGTYDLLISPESPPPAGDYSDVVLEDGPVGYWRFGEPSGTLLTDSSPNDNDGQYVGGVALGVPGALAGDPDTAARFDGVNDLGRVPDDNSLDVGNQFTAEGWIKRSSDAKTHTMMAKGFQLTIMNAGTGNQVWLRKPNVSTIARSNAPVPAGAYHHVAVTKNGSGPGAVKIYIDGQPVGVVDVAPAQVIQNTTGALVFGTAASNAADFDEFAIYDGALSAAQILEHYQAGTAAAT